MGYAKHLEITNILKSSALFLCVFTKKTNGTYYIVKIILTAIDLWSQTFNLYQFMKKRFFYVILLFFISSSLSFVNAQYYNPYMNYMNMQFMNYAQQSWHNHQQQMNQNWQTMQRRKQQLQEQFARDAAERMKYNNQGTNTYNNSINYHSTNTNSNNSSNNVNQNTSRYTDKDCHGCLGSGKCNTCNGKGWYYAIGSSNTINCPNCTNGRCSICGGTGKVRGLR